MKSSSQLLLKKDDKSFERIAKKFNLRLILLFGSAVSKKVHSQSDIDIAVLFQKPNLSFKKYSNLHLELQRLFPKVEVDLALLNQADPLFLKKITEKCAILYGKPRDLALLKIYAFKRYVDHQKFFKMEEEFARKFITQYVGGK